MPVPTAETIRRLLAERPTTTVDDPSLAPAGAMLLLYPNDEDPSIILTKRSQLVDRHKGEVSFPGGVAEDSDRDLQETALRETFEELGVRPDDVTLLGALGEMPTSTRFLLSTYVGTIPYPYEFNPCEAEVAAVLEVPIQALLSGDHVRDEVRVVDGKLVNSPSYVYGGNLIFGATARILTRFMETIGAPERSS
jgi:8-oxo-dGTP pyrophosphatase MutT (NUDIX family)